MGMPNENPAATASRATWQVGQRVSRRKNSRELGTVIENDGSIKVKWDSGQTSYFRHGEAVNIKLKVASSQE
jgi:flagellar basal body rod protein FlgF